MRHGVLLFVVIVASLAAVSTPMALDDDEPSGSVQPSVAVETPESFSTLPHHQVPIEEIVVRGERSPRLWRMHIERAEDDLYRLFNGLVDNRDYRVICRRESSVGSYIPVRHCEPGFVTRERSRLARNVVADWRNGEDDQQARVMRDAINNNAVSESDMLAGLEEKYENLNQYMLELALEHPELMAALQRLGELQAAYSQHVE